MATVLNPENYSPDSPADMARMREAMGTPKRKQLGDSELAIILAEQEYAAISFRDSQLSDEQANAIDYYEAEPFGDEEDGRSQVVVPDVAEVVDYMQISMLRTVASGDRVVEFEPSDSEDMPEAPEEAPEQPQPGPDGQPDPNAMQQYAMAKQQYDQANAAIEKWEKARTKAADDATEAVNYIFMQRQNGWKVLLDWCQSGLIEKIGIIKTACVTDKVRRRERMLVDEEGLTLLTQQGAQIAAATQTEEGWLIEISQDREIRRYVDYPIPSEEYLFSGRTRDEDSAEYQAHRSRKTLSDLVEMGFDRETVESLPADAGTGDLDSRSISRWNDEDDFTGNDRAEMRKVWLLEEYVRIDRDDDGIAELLKVFRVGDVILEIEEVDEPPFVVWSPFPRAHRLVGNSLAEKVMDLQRIDSVMLRQALDGVYMTNNPRMWLPNECVDENTIDDLLTVRSGGIVRGKGSGGKPEPLYEAFSIDKSLGMLEYTAGLREQRTGITRLNQGLDADTLNKTASGQAMLQATGQQIEEFVARNFAEAIGRLFGKKLRLMAEHGETMAIRVDGRYRKVQPGSWDRDMLVSVRVGLGSGRKDQRLMYRQSLAEMQQQGLQIGITDPKRIFNNVSAMVRDANLGPPTDYWLDPDSEDGKAAQAQMAQRPDPEMAKVQAQSQQAQAKLQIDAQTSQAKMALDTEQAQQTLQLSQAETAAKLETMRQEAALKLQLEREKAEAEASLAERKFQFEAEQAMRQQEFEMRMAEQQAERQHEIAIKQADAKISQNRPGGDLDK